MSKFHMLNQKQRDVMKDWRERCWIDENLRTPQNFAALIDFIFEKDKLWESQKSVVDMNTLKDLS